MERFQTLNKYTNRFWVILFFVVLLMMTCGKGSKTEKEIHRVYWRYHRALLQEDMGQLKDLLGAKQKKMMLGEGSSDTLKQIIGMRPKDIKITGTTVSENSATLELAGSMMGEKITGSVKMVKEDGWRVAGENWKVTINMDSSSLSAIGPIEPFFKGRDKPPKKSQILEGHQGAVSELCFTPEGQYLISASYDDYSIRMWDLPSGEQVAFAKTDNRIRDMELSNDGTFLYAADAHLDVMVYEIGFGEIGNPRLLMKKSGDELALDPKGKFIATTSYQKPVQIWNLDDGTEVNTLETKSDQRTLVFSPDGKYLVSGGGKDNAYNVWKLPKWFHKKYPVKKIGKDSFNNAIHFSRNGEWMAMGFNDSSIVIINTNRFKEGYNFYVPRASTQDVAFSPGGDVLATAQYNNNVYIWSIQSGARLAVLKGHDGPVQTLTFGPDCLTLASGSDDRNIILWKSGEDVVAVAEDSQSKSPENEMLHSEDPGMADFSGRDNLVKNPSANQLIQDWKTKGEVTVENDDKGNPIFVIRYSGYFFQDVALEESTGSFALLIAWASSERIESDDNTGLPYLYGSMLNRQDPNRINSYLNHESMTFSSINQADQWDVIWGIYQIPPETGGIRIFLQQADGKSSQNGSAAKFDDVGIFIFESEDEARQFVNDFTYQ